MARPGPVVLRALARALVAYLGILTLVGGAGLWGLRGSGGVAVSGPGALWEARDAAARVEIEALRLLAGTEPSPSRALRALDRLEASLPALAPEGEGLGPLLAEVKAARRALEEAGREPGPGGAATSLVALPRLAEALERGADRQREEAARRLAEARDRAELARRTVAAALGAGWLLALVTAGFGVRRLQAPFQEVLAFLGAAADKDLRGHLTARSRDELGALARAASSLGSTLVVALGTLGRAAAEAASRGQRMLGRAQDTRERSEARIERVEAGGSKAREIEQTLAPLHGLAEQMWDGAEQSASSVQQILAMTQQVRAEMDGLCQRVTSANASVEELSGATSRVAVLTTQVGAAAQSVAAAAAAIDSATETLSARAAEGRGLTEDVVGKAEAGRASMAEALRGMERIRQAVGAAVERLDRLEGELFRVGRVTQVIDDIAGRTNLLSLNAAIIAAQSGERGKAFGVVAGEIRSLAEKTAASTREIRSIVDGVVGGGRDAAQAVSEGAARVAEGARQAERTGELLGAIHASATRAAGSLREIEAAAGGQAEEAARVAGEIAQLSEGVENIARAIHDQEARARAVHADLSEIDLVARQTLNAADEQTRGTELITRTVVDVSHASERVKEAIAQVAVLLRGLREDLEALGGQARRDLEQVSQLEVEGAGLASLAGDIQREVGAFRLPPAGAP